MNLYLVNTIKYPAYVIAEGPSQAYKKFRDWLDRNKYGFDSDRNFKNITKIADSISKPDMTIYNYELLIV